MSAKLETIVVTVTTAGTQVQVSATPIYVDQFIVEGKRGNTGFIFVGDADVSSADYAVSLASAVNHRFVAPHQDNKIDLSSVWIDSSVNGEIAMVTYYKKNDNV
jgi:hypothetical protein